ncbi:hypothetical protein ACFX13_036386 [Malus domestica]
MVIHVFGKVYLRGGGMWEKVGNTITSAWTKEGREALIKQMLGEQLKDEKSMAICIAYTLFDFMRILQIYDRDRLTLGEFVKEDMYIRDLKNTKGHISGLTCGEWNPKSKNTILTSSEDRSLRIWDVNDLKTQKQVIKPKLTRPGRVPVTTCIWDHDEKRIAGGIGDGVEDSDPMAYKMPLVIR